MYEKKLLKNLIKEKISEETSEEMKQNLKNYFLTLVEWQSSRKETVKKGGRK